MGWFGIGGLPPSMTSDGKVTNKDTKKGDRLNKATKIKNLTRKDSSEET